MTSRDRIDRAAHGAGRRPISRAVRAELDAALAEVEALTADVLQHDPPAQVTTYLRDLYSLAADRSRVVRP